MGHPLTKIDAVALVALGPASLSTHECHHVKFRQCEQAWVLYSPRLIQLTRNRPSSAVPVTGSADLLTQPCWKRCRVMSGQNSLKQAKTAERQRRHNVLGHHRLDVSGGSQAISRRSTVPGSEWYQERSYKNSYSPIMPIFSAALVSQMAAASRASSFTSFLSK